MSKENSRPKPDDQPRASRPMNHGQTNESGGGSYPNPRDADNGNAGNFKGGQSEPITATAS